MNKNATKRSPVCNRTHRTRGIGIFIAGVIFCSCIYLSERLMKINQAPQKDRQTMTNPASQIDKRTSTNPALQKDYSTIQQSSIKTSVYNNSLRYICPIFDGGTGNQMFQFASSYGIARYKNMEVIVHEECKLMALFKLDVVILKDVSVCNSFRTLREINNAVYDRRMIDFDRNTNVRLTIYLQAYRYFDDYSSDLRKQFTFRDEIQTKADTVMAAIFQRNNVLCGTKNLNFLHKKENGIQRTCHQHRVEEVVTFVGVHVRRGDWLLPPHPGLGFQTASSEYLHTAVKWYQSRYRNIIFIVASNDMAWTKQNMPVNITIEYLEGNSLGVEMAALALCDHFIATTGTFSWWIGWLIGGNVTYFKWPAKENTEFRRSFGKDYTDHFYPSWVGL